jgi:hypothetical protein
MADILSREAVMDAVGSVGYREIGSVTNDDQALFGRAVLELV